MRQLFIVTYAQIIYVFNEPEAAVDLAVAAINKFTKKHKHRKQLLSDCGGLSYISVDKLDKYAMADILEKLNVQNKLIVSANLEEGDRLDITLKKSIYQEDK